jgi:hypothetical protein
MAANLGNPCGLDRVGLILTQTKVLFLMRG